LSSPELISTGIVQKLDKKLGQSATQMVYDHSSKFQNEKPLARPPEWLCEKAFTTHMNGWSLK
jgi:hypothetical protein